MEKLKTKTVIKMLQDDGWLEMEIVKVTVDWLDNYGAVSDQVPGCVATAGSYEAIKEAYASALEFHKEGLDVNEVPACLQGEYKLNDVFVGVPVKLGSNGIEEIIELNLTDQETFALKKSADDVAAQIAKLHL